MARSAPEQAQPSGRQLEAIGNGGPRVMAVLDRIRLIGFPETTREEAVRLHGLFFYSRSAKETRKRVNFLENRTISVMMPMVDHTRLRDGKR